MRTLLGPVVPSVGLLDVFCVPVTVSCPFPSRFFSLSLSLWLVNIVGWTVLTGSVIISDLFTVLTLISVVHMDRYMLILWVAVARSFSFQFMHCFQEPRNVKPVKTPFFQIQSFNMCLWTFVFLWCQRLSRLTNLPWKMLKPSGTLKPLRQVRWSR